MRYDVGMAKQKNPKGSGNKELYQAMLEKRRSSAASPHDTRPKRLRTDEKVVEQELRDEEM
jgi:hypothetical protein